MRNFLLVLFILLVNISFSQEIVTDSLKEDSIYFEEDSYIDDDYYDNENYEQEYSGFISYMGIQLKKQMITKPEKFDFVLFGFELGLYKQINKDLPFFLGGSLSLDLYGKESYEYLDYGYDDGYEYRFSDDFTAYVFNVDFGGKYFSKKSFWVLNPYVQLDFEYRYAFATINTINSDLDETINTDYKKGNYGLGYNFGVGSLIDINTDGLFLYFSINYNSGGGLFLYNRRPGNYEIFSVLDNFDYKYFPIGFLTFKFGMAFSK